MSAIFDAYADYYDLLYRDKDYAGEARYVQSLLGRHGKGRGAILDLGCGTGRHAIELARFGYQVFGIDASARMIAQARERMPSACRDRLAFETGDVRTARLGRRFEAVVSLFHVASYQTTNADLGAMLTTVREHLAPGGIFVCDFWYGPGVLTDPPQVRTRMVEGAGGSVTRTARPVMLPEQNCVDVSYTLHARRPGVDTVGEINETHRMRYLFLPELRSLLADAGLELATAEAWLGGELGPASWNAVLTAGHRP